ncbi:hypothetical protein [Thermoflavimicrobium daqui]|uniref:Beta-ketoacyl-[acyl-carrier-protein] synthase III C-terminal domain-containing protein n=1 Tax=Thermoflavimicrobium daqui TaxID=2137476 RepID=A0A364K150_9BACL|nr:hypothetical protein [Thermoflavimicrobium daqui]RAL21419.1 hypothetical protein DL897_16360 [Thermoflavimicrobium daqui]
MGRLLLHVHTVIPDTVTTLEQDEQDQENPWMESEPFQWMKRTYHFPQETRLAFRHIPIPELRMSTADFAYTHLQSQPSFQLQIDGLIYCHETLELSPSLIPSLKLRKRMKWKKSLPLTLGQMGSLSCINGLTLANQMIQSQAVETLWLLCIADRVSFPFHRHQWSGYPKGDGITCLSVSRKQGGYALLDSQFHLGSIQPDIQTWSFAEYEQAVHRLIDHVKELWKRYKDHDQPIDLIIPQMIHEEFISQLVQQLEANVFLRTNWPQINLLGSDPWYSLSEAEKSGQVKEGQMILLIFGSVDYGIGSLLLKKR